MLAALDENQTVLAALDENQTVLAALDENQTVLARHYRVDSARPMTPVTYIREQLDVGPAVKARLEALLRYPELTPPHEYVMRDGRRVCSACELSEAEAKVGDGSAVPCLGRPAR